MRGAAARAGLHADLYSSKFQPRALQYVDQGRNALPQQAGSGAGRSNQGKIGRAGVIDPDLCGEGWWQAVPNAL
jgi:hypothetical protein